MAFYRPMVKASIKLLRVFLALAAFPFAAQLSAATLTVDPAQSQITLAGTVSGFKLQEQATGSLTTTVGGTVDIVTSPGQLQITNALLTPNINGTWKPGTNGAASSPADLSGKANSLVGEIDGALRNLLVTATSGPKTLDASGNFDASSILFAFPANSTSVLDYDSFVTGKGSKQLASVGTNQTATVGSFIESNGAQTLTIVINATFYFSLLLDNDSQLTLTGKLVATSAPPSGPTIIGIQIVNNQVQFTATGTSTSTGVQSSINLNDWGRQPATITAPDASTRVFTIPVSLPFQFFRLTQ
jgi:hypothetical protein